MEVFGLAELGMKGMLYFKGFIAYTWDWKEVFHSSYPEEWIQIAENQESQSRVPKKQEEAGPWGCSVSGQTWWEMSFPECTARWLGARGQPDSIAS